MCLYNNSMVFFIDELLNPMRNLSSKSICPREESVNRLQLEARIVH